MRKKPYPILDHLAITALAEGGRGIGHAPDGRVVFVPWTMPGDTVQVQVTQRKKNFMEARLLEIIIPSSDRLVPQCTHFTKCGGCKMQHIPYDLQLAFKHQIAVDALQRIGKIKPDRIDAPVGADRTTYYRNKLEYTFSNKRWLTEAEFRAGVPNQVNATGYHVGGAFDRIIHIDQCWLQEDPSNAIRDTFHQIGESLGCTFFDAKTKMGDLRQLVIRITSTGEVMIIIGFGVIQDEIKKMVIDRFLTAFPNCTSVYSFINPKSNDFYGDLDCTLVTGKTHIQEQLGHLKYVIGPKSFFQTNSYQAVKLYNLVVEFAQLQAHELVYDLYTGTGTIALYLASRCRHVIGIEEVGPAIEDAHRNAELNGITNVTFYTGDVLKICTEAFVQEHGAPDCWILDPPRAGCHPDVLPVLLHSGASRIVYVSCNPATQARDCAVLSEKYRCVRSCAVDMFPHTAHVENVVLLELIK